GFSGNHPNFFCRTREMRLALASIANSTWVACVALAGELRAELEGSPLPENLAFRLVSLSLH
ncbi:hypothetical protein ACQE9C_28805, partial [Klebsiella pneumoniae]